MGAFPFPLENLHEDTRKVVGCFLFVWFLGATTIFFLSSLYHSEPFRITTTLGHNQKGKAPSSSIPIEHNTSDGTNEKSCDLFSGRWVREPRRPAYNNQSCPMMAEWKDCGKYGKDMGYLNWKWKPDGCELPSLEPGEFLSIVGGKKIMFIGDSVARNQVESLLCLLAQAETPTEMYKDTEDKFQTWYFPYHDFTLMVVWSRFLVVATERVINGSASAAFDIHLDQIDPNFLEKLPGVHYAIISSGHWFFRKSYLYESGNLIGCVFCSEPNVTEFSPQFAIQKIFRTALQFINKCQECHSLFTLLRTFSPAHFENGSWNNGGSCNRTQPLDEGDVDLSGTSGPGELRDIQVEEIDRIRGENKGRIRFEILDVTKAMLMRPDGHPDSHWNNKWMKGYNDCLHWCLPGPVDFWNDLLHSMLKKIQQ